MAEPQSLAPNLSEMMEEYTAGKEDVHLEPQTETTPVAEPEVQERQKSQLRKEESRKELNKAKMSKLKSHTTIKLLFQMKPTSFGKRI